MFISVKKCLSTRFTMYYVVAVVIIATLMSDQGFWYFVMNPSIVF